MITKAATNKIERILFSKGFSFVCGLDEAGRGALAGPLVAAAVILPQKKFYNFKDSKLLNPIRRDRLSQIIKKVSLTWAVGISQVDEINKMGIQKATYLAFYRAIDGLAICPDSLLIDYYSLPSSKILQFSVLSGDKISQSIAAASILAKTSRDKIMRSIGLKDEYREYGFTRHFGYGTKYHQDKISKMGISNLHRIQFCHSLNLSEEI